MHTPFDEHSSGPMNFNILTSPSDVASRYALPSTTATAAPHFSRREEVADRVVAYSSHLQGRA